MIIKPLPILFSMEPMRFYIYPILLKEDSELTLIDCGYPGDLPKIEEAFANAGEDIRCLKNVLITHHDHDHMGALRELIKKYPKVKVFASAEQIPYITGKRKSLRLWQAENKKMDKGLIAMIKSVEYIGEVIPISDHQMFPLGEGVTVLQTDGHMPGHLSFYVGERNALITGDALTCENGVLSIADPEFVLDREKELKTLRILLDYKIDEIYCYHGGRYVSDDIHGDIERILEAGYVSV